MILQALYKKGLKENYDLAFIETPTPFVIEINRKGKLLGAQFLGERRTDENGKRLNGYEYKTFRLPFFGQKKTMGITSRYIAESWQYLFGLQKREKRAKLSQEKLDRARKCHEHYKKSLEEIIKRTGSAEVKALLKCVETINKDPRILFNMMKTEDAGKIAVHFSGAEETFPSYWEKSQILLPFVDGKPIFECCGIEEDWRSVFKAKYYSSKRIVQDLITGDPCDPIEFHSPVKIRGGQTSGALLVSFNCESFETFNREGNENAPIGKMSSLVSFRTLIELLRSRKNQYFFPSGSTALFWGLGDPTLEDIYQDILEADPETIRNIFTAPWKGTLPEEGSLDFCSILLKGEEGRISSRDFMLRSHKDVLSCLKRYYTDLDTGLLSRPLSLRAILRAAFRNPEEGSTVEPLLYRAATEGTAFPQRILQALIHRIKPNDFFRNTLLVTASYGKAFINRSIDMGRISNRSRLEVDMNLNGSIPYRLGRLLAVLEHLKSMAIPKSPHLAQSAMKLFLSRPLVAMNLHLPRSNHHLRKIDGGLAVWYKQLIGSIMEGVESVPSELSVEDKAELSLGYLHQNQDLYKSKKEKKDD